jgi:hypothetical protein
MRLFPLFQNFAAKLTATCRGFHGLRLRLSRNSILNTFLRRITWLFLLIGSVPLIAGNPLQLPEQVNDRLLAALEANYRMDFAAGAAELESLRKWEDQHPMIPFGQLLIEWWKVTAAVWEEDEDLCAPMLAAAEHSLGRAETLIAKGDPTGEGHMIKGATLGLLGRWHIKNRRWWKSYTVGKDAKSNLKRAIEINPEIYDALAGIGIYDYFVAKLPGIVRWLAFTGQSADPADGMRLILESIDKGTYTPVGTRAALALVQLRNELDPLAAMKLADELIAEHPHSPFFGSLRLIALYDSNQTEALAEEAQRQAELLSAGDYPAERAAQVHFAAGLAEFRWMNWEKAETAYKKAIEHGHPTDPFVTWATLHLGNMKDVRGDRRGARAIYREVENLLNRWGTERLAERYLKKPFDPTIHQVRLLPDG